MKKRLLSMLMVVLMVFALLPAAAFAADKCAHEEYQTIDIKFDADAKTPGIKAEVCVNCGHVKSYSVTPFAKKTAQCDVCTDPVTVVMQEAGCDKVGIKLTYCKTCGKQMKGIEPIGIKAESHAYELTVVETPTCKRDGWGYAVCSKCGDAQFVDGPDEAVATLPSNAKQADKDAVAKKFAQVKHNVKVVENDKDLNKDGKIVKGVDLLKPIAAVHPESVDSFAVYGVKNLKGEYMFASKDGKGYSGDKACTYCGEQIVRGKTTDNLTVQHMNQISLTVPGFLPGITEKNGLPYDGQTDKFYCAECQAWFGGEPIDFYEYYDLQKGAETIVVGKKAASCTEEGYTGDTYVLVDTLDANGQVMKDENGNVMQHYMFKNKGEVIEKVEHSWTAMPDKPATCFVDGERYDGGKVCTVCGLEEFNGQPSVIPAAHKSDFKVLVEATCQNKGLSVEFCPECGMYIQKYTTAVVDHEGQVVGAVEATCTEAGYTGDTVCKFCGDVIAKGEKVEALGHKASEERKDVKAATATEDGYTGDVVCAVCGEVMEKGEVIPATGVNFVDVDKDAFYADAVDWAVKNDVTKGIDATHFAPNAACTRAQMVTFLWRAAGCPAAAEGAENPFTDVKEGAYYYDAVLWAVSNGVTKGTSATTFSPNATVTRAQVVTFLFRFDGGKAISAENPFKDVVEGQYYYDAVLWAVENGVTTGKTAVSFAPNDDCTRGQIVTFLYRYCTK